MWDTALKYFFPVLQITSPDHLEGVTHSFSAAAALEQAGSPGAREITRIKRKPFALTGLIILVIGGSSTSTHSLRSLVGIESRGQDFLEVVMIRSKTSDSADNSRLNSQKQEAVTVLVVLTGRQTWFVLENLISAIFWAKNFPKSLAN